MNKKTMEKTGKWKTFCYLSKHNKLSLTDREDLSLLYKSSTM